MKKILEKLKQKGVPEKGFFHVENISNFNDHLLGLDSDNYIILLIKCQINKNDINPISSIGEYLNILYQNECKIKKESSEFLDKYTVLQLKSNNNILENTFLNICEYILNKLGDIPALDDTITVLESIKKLFSKLLNSSSKTELGLWGELFLIYFSKDYEYLIDSWHKKNNDTFDFNDGINKVEVKTTVKNERKHNFSLNQLENSISNSAVICSIMTSEIDMGYSIHFLLQEISSKISIDYKIKLDEKIIEVAGKDISIFKSKYDITSAKNSIKFYESSIVPSIKKENISKEVTNVKFSSSLETVEPLKIKEFNEGILLRF